MMMSVLYESVKTARGINTLLKISLKTTVFQLFSILLFKSRGLCRWSGTERAETNPWRWSELQNSHLRAGVCSDCSLQDPVIGKRWDLPGLCASPSSWLRSSLWRGVACERREESRQEGGGEQGSEGGATVVRSGCVCVCVEKVGHQGESARQSSFQENTRKHQYHQHRQAGVKSTLKIMQQVSGRSHSEVREENMLIRSKGGRWDDNTNSTKQKKRLVAIHRTLYLNMLLEAHC